MPRLLGAGQRPTGVRRHPGAARHPAAARRSKQAPSFAGRVASGPPTRPSATGGMAPPLSGALSASGTAPPRGGVPSVPPVAASSPTTGPRSVAGRHWPSTQARPGLQSLGPWQPIWRSGTQAVRATAIETSISSFNISLSLDRPTALPRGPEFSRRRQPDSNRPRTRSIGAMASTVCRGGRCRGAVQMSKRGAPHPARVQTDLRCRAANGAWTRGFHWPSLNPGSPMLG